MTSCAVIAAFIDQPTTRPREQIDDGGHMGDKWIHEIKFDGYRVQVHLNKGKVKIFTRNGHDWTNRFHLIAESFDIPVERAIFNGEVVVIKDGRTNFSELQAALASGRQGSIEFYAIDLLSGDLLFEAGALP